MSWGIVNGGMGQQAKSLKLKTFLVISSATSQPISASVIETSFVLIQSGNSNTGIVYVGDSGVSTGNGFEISIGDCFSLKSDSGGNRADDMIDLNKIWIVGIGLVKVSYLEPEIGSNWSQV